MAEDTSQKTAGKVYASLDLGSNSFHMVVARFETGKLVVIDRHKESVRLASGLRADGTLTKSAVTRALESLYRFAERLSTVAITEFRVVGTNTLRAAKNADSFLERAEEILQSPINIISGAEEARLIFLGVSQDFTPDQNQRLVLDIGGGSTELIVGDHRKQRLQSLHLGCVVYSQRFFSNGKISSKRYRKATLAARAEFQSVVSTFHRDKWHEAVGASGTIRAIEAVLEGMQLNHDHVITRAGIEALAAAVCEFYSVEELCLPNLSDARKQVFAGGLAILHALFMELAIDELHVSSYALREGIIFDLAGVGSDKDRKFGGTRGNTVARLMSQYHVDEQQVKRTIRFANGLLDQVIDQLDQGDRARELMCWALSLHEIGLALSHSGHHKHGAYLLLHSDMPGFSKQEQKQLSFLVLNHRRKLRSVSQTYGFDPDWKLVQIIRLACLFCRRRDAAVLPEKIHIHYKNNDLKLQLDRDWVANNPLSKEDLLIEKQYLQNMKLKLNIKEV